MAGKVRTRGGAVLLTRLGRLADANQDAWDRAPTRRGMWAFPWPAFEMFFAYHQFLNAAPIRLRTGAGGIPTHPSAWVDAQGDHPAAVTTWAEMHDSPYSVRDGFRDDQAAWIDGVGRTVVRKRQFWYDGDLYTHLRPNGEILALDKWERMPARLFADAVRRSGGNRYLDVAGGTMNSYRTSSDHLEVFLPAGAGRAHGRPDSTRPPRRPQRQLLT